ncbi:uncharacterized protein C8Q71DRAFT_725176 [Rhodofomes roseus]|uniref:Uncharacterized protein n=1 Tax=Rhodofomes roseus TaxID=34475 RepID=A0ABQ8KBL0_9APHY|nr:uncharacterized protein C8Q71DRAFT_725176 [Rhodofomes roseus]KAH9834647.1 hypothetical protein C8Q71DRAFT_725176 [Rhodofomes roseus]
MSRSRLVTWHALRLSQAQRLRSTSNLRPELRVGGSCQLPAIAIAVKWIPQSPPGASGESLFERAMFTFNPRLVAVSIQCKRSSCPKPTRHGHALPIFASLQQEIISDAAVGRDRLYTVHNRQSLPHVMRAEGDIALSLSFYVCQLWSAAEPVLSLSVHSRLLLEAVARRFGAHRPSKHSLWSWPPLLSEPATSSSIWPGRRFANVSVWPWRHPTSARHGTLRATRSYLRVLNLVQHVFNQATIAAGCKAYHEHGVQTNALRTERKQNGIALVNVSASPCRMEGTGKL